MDARSVLDLSEVRPPFLVNLLDSCRRPGPGQAQADDRAAVLTIFPIPAMPRFHLDDDIDDEDFDEDEDDEDSDESDEDSDEDPEDDIET